MWIARDRSPRSPNRPRPSAISLAISLAVGALLAVAPAPARAGSATASTRVEAVPTTAGTIEARAGSTLTVSFRVTNPGDSLGRFDEALDLPAGWVPIVATEPFSLDPHSSGGRIFAVRIPQTAEPATYDILYRVVNNGGMASMSEGKTTVRVRANATLLLTVEEAPESYVGVGECRARLRLSNQGNVPLDPTLRIEAEPELRAEWSPSSLHLEAGDDAIVDVTFQIPDHELAPTRFAPRVKAEASLPDGSRVSSSATISFEAVPSRMPSDRFRRAPAVLVLGAGGTGGRVGTQAEVRGSSGNPRGTLIDFQLRPAASTAMGPYAGREVYALSVRDPSFDALVGDQTFGLSRLMEQSIYGRGASVAIRVPHGFEIGGCGMNSRTEPRAGKEDWFYGSKRFGDRGSFGLGMMDRNSGRDGAIRDRLYNLTGRIRASDLASCAFEYATSHRGGDATGVDVLDGVPVGSGGKAYFLTAEGSARPASLRYGVTKSHAARGFTGELRDSDRLDARIQGNPWHGAQAGLCLSRRETNRSLADPLSPGSRERLVVATLGQSLPYRSRVGLEGSVFHGGDFRNIAAPQEERVAGLTLERATRRLVTRAEVRTGTILDPEGESRVRAWMLGLHGTFRPTPDTYLTAHYSGAARGNGPITRGRVLRDRGEIEVSTGIDIEGKLELDLRGRSTQTRLTPDAVSLNGRLVLSNGTILSLQLASGDRLGATSPKDAPFLLTWTVPFTFPVGRKTSLDVVKGRVVDAEAPGEKGIAGAIVRVDGVIGAAGPDGKFTIRIPPAASHVITVDAGSVGIGRVLASPMPMRIGGGHGQDPVRIEVVRSSRIEGTVVRVAVDGRKKSMPGASVQITMEKETLKTVTDDAGRFFFSDLRPGTWTVTASPRGSARTTTHESAAIAVVAAPGATVEAAIEIHDRPRELRMIDSGTVKGSGSPSQLR